MLNPLRDADVASAERAELVRVSETRTAASLNDSTPDDLLTSVSNSSLIDVLVSGRSTSMFQAQSVIAIW